MVKNPLAKVGHTRDVGSILGSGRSPGVGNGNPVQYSCLENSTEELGRLQSMGSQKSDQIEQLSAHTHSLPTKMLISSETLSQTYQK